LHIQPGSTILLNISKPEADLLAGMHPKTRYNIKVAQKHGVEIRPLTQPDDQHLAAHMMRNTLIRRKLVSPPQEYYFKLMGHFSNGTTLSTHTYGAYYNNDLVACALAVDFNQTRTYLFGGSSTAHKNVMAPYVLHWTIIKDAKNNNLHLYDWFGAEGSVSDGSGFARFKQSFGGETIQYAEASDIIFKPLAYRAYQTTRHLNRWIRHK
jgi:lipid II:glycine glycyltransferase (peptidoglycan interpeptide bridge formation enzyme)